MVGDGGEDRGTGENPTALGANPRNLQIQYLAIAQDCQRFSPGPGRVGQLVRALSQQVKVTGSIPSEGTYKKQPMNAQISGTTNQCFSLSIRTPLPL